MKRDQKLSHHKIHRELQFIVAVQNEKKKYKNFKKRIKLTVLGNTFSKYGMNFLKSYL